MGGKTKQSQRTKNNVRPSSSGRSAELLNNTVRIDPGVVGGGKALPALFPTLATPLDPALSPDLSLCLKKLNKKDPITKTKALQELCELVTSSDVEDVVAALPSWARHYRALTTHTEHKVREAAQTAHGVIVGVCGRRTAPQLKALLPAWLQAQYDEYAPAAAAARASLASTFPESKLPDVLTFCMAEVMAALADNLLGGADAALDKQLSPEDREQQWARVVAGSLRGLEFFALQLPAQHDAWLWAQLQPLLQAPDFWKMAAHKLQSVRSAWYGALGRVIARFGDTFGEAYGQKTARLLLNTPGGQQQWACLLLLLRHKQADAWFDKKDLLVKRIIDVLENGGWGDAKHLSTVLLPLLAYLPEHMLTKEFYESFFNAVFKGLEKKSVMSSKSERQSWITSLSECLRYLTLQQGEFVVEVATSVHRSWLERVLASGRDSTTSANLVKHSASSMAALVKYWLKQSQQAGEKYDQLARNFWQNVASTMVTQINKLSTDQNDITGLLELHTLLLQTLKTGLLQETKKTKSIKFNDEPQVAVAEDAESTQQCDASVLERYKHNLDNVVEKICAQYFEFASKKQVANIVFCPLLTLLKEFDEKNLFVALARHFEADSVYGLYDKVLRGWLAGDTMRCRALVDVVFLLLKHLSEKEQDAMLDSFKQFPPSVVEWCISLALSHPHCGVAAVKRWLRGDLVETSLLGVSRRMIAEDDGKARSLLLMCLATDDEGEMMISPSTVSGVMAAVSSALRSSSASLERVAGAAAALLSELSGAADCTALAAQLFRTQLHTQRGSGVLSVETWCEARSAWQEAGARCLVFRREAARAARELLADSDISESLDVGKLEHVASLCPYLLPEFDDCRVPEHTADAAQLVRLLFEFPDSEDIVVETFALQHDCLHSNLNCPLDDTASIRDVIARSDRPSPDLAKRDLIAYTNRVVFRAALLRTLLVHKDEEDRPWGEELLKEEYVEAELARVFHDYAVVCSLHDGYAFWPHYDVIATAKRHLSCALDAIISDVLSSRSGLYARLSLRAATDGYYWSLAKVALASMLREKHVDVETSKQDAVKLEDVVTGSGFFHTLQAESKCAPDDSPLRAKYLVMLRSVYLAHAHEPHVVDATFVRAASVARNPRDPGVVVDTYYRHQHVMLYESDIATAEWRQVVSNTAIVDYLTEMVETCGWEAEAASWDFTTISLCSLTAAVHGAQASWACPKVAMLTRAVLKLFLSVHRFVGSIQATCLKREPAPHVAELPTEWRDIFAPDLHYNLFSIVVKVLAAGDRSPTAAQAGVLDALLDVTRALDWHQLPQAHQNGGLSVTTLLQAAVRALTEPVHHGYKYLAHALLMALSKPVVLHDAEQLAAWTADSSEESASESPRVTLALQTLRPALQTLHHLVDTTLASLKVGEETCEMVPFTDSHSLALGYLLLSEAAYTTCQLARQDLLHHYMELGRRMQHSEGVVAACLRLLPAPAAQHARDSGNTSPPAQYTHMFLNAPEFSLTEPSSSLDIGRLSCRLVYLVARGAGGALRGWWGAAPAKAARALERLLATHVSPALIREQLQAVMNNAGELEDAEVVVHWSTNEAVCTFRVEDRPLELSISLGAAHPLPPPRVAAAGAPQHSAQWLAVYLAYQNGTVLNALKMWMGAVTKRVEAAPQCYICYCRLHPGSGRLPKVTCHQCRNKFHAECLRKWFQTSSKSNCPLCRATF